MNQTEIDFTRAWWKSLLEDNNKMVKWLQKLQLTEIGGYDDWLTFLERWPDMAPKTFFTLDNIAQDEQKHSNLLLDLFKERGISPVEQSLATTSTYWMQMYTGIEDLQTCCAANYYGEALASDRFDIIVTCKETPSDLKEVFKKILPDEIFHREALKRLAGEEALAKLAELHASAVQNLKGQPKVEQGVT